MSERGAAMDQPGRSLAHETEAAVRRLKGVSAARIDLGEDGTVARVHVLASAERSPKVIVADVVATLASQFGISLEPTQVRVAGLRPGQPESAPASPPRARLKFVGLTVSRLRSSAEVRVQLEHDGLVYEGAAAGPSAASRLLELVGQATLRAVETYLRADQLFLVQAATVVQAASHQVALLVVSWLGPEEQTLSGSAVVRGEPREAMVHAALDAVNRTVLALGAP